MIARTQERFDIKLSGFRGRYRLRFGSEPSTGVVKDKDSLRTSLVIDKSIETRGWTSVGRKHVRQGPVTCNCPANKILTTTASSVNDGRHFSLGQRRADCRGCLLSTMLSKGRRPQNPAQYLRGEARDVCTGADQRRRRSSNPSRDRNRVEMLFAHLTYHASAGFAIAGGHAVPSSHVGERFAQNLAGLPIGAGHHRSPLCAA